MRYDGVCSQRWLGSEAGFLSTAGAAAPSLSYFALYPFLHPPIHPRPPPPAVQLICKEVQEQGLVVSRVGMDGRLQLSATPLLQTFFAPPPTPTSAALVMLPSRLPCSSI